MTDKKLPKPSEPSRPAHANEGAPRLEAPVWPEDYDTSEQPNQPEKLLGVIKPAKAKKSKDTEEK